MTLSIDPMLVGNSAQERNKRFGKMPKRGNIKYSSMGCGVVYDGKRGMGKRAYYHLQIATCLKRDFTPSAPKLIRNGVVIS